jgi:hypothetical protein
MNARTKLRWVDIPRRSLREGLACGRGGVQVLLMMGDDRQSVEPSGATPPPDAPADAHTADRSR